ncbi:MAG: geranylgeranyl diphosphate synthase, type [Acidobacteriota bacterium]|jgi:geranylgeranyl diphosphate synthase type I|nr:geranylgeranyl diphosphate synthase, type [Acidobacteriota bacterium]
MLCGPGQSKHEAKESETPGMELSTAASKAQSVPEGFPALLEGFRERLDRELHAWLEAKRRAAAEAGSPEMLELIDGVGQLVVHGGKRVRPALVYHAYRACGGAADGPVGGQILPLALATEFLHTYLLIHDDIMDHAEMRRGQPAAHVRFRNAHSQRGFHGDARDFGLSVAILLGDLAHTWAVELASCAAAGRPELARCFAAMSEEVIGGQYLELLVAQRRAAKEEELTRVLRLKSGRYTAERPVQLGAILAGAAPEVIAGLALYGAAVGEAFQLQDDLLGMFGEAETVGKPVGDDLREGKFTFLIHHALSAATPEQREALENALGDPGVTADEVARVQRILEETGARARVEAMIEERLLSARQALQGLGELRQEGRLFLEGLLDYLWEREL